MEAVVPAKKQKILFAVFYTLFIVQMPFAVLFFIEKYPAFVKILFRMSAADMLFNLTGNLIFGLSAFIMWIPFSFFLLQHIFSAVFDMEDTFKYYRKKYIQNYPHMHIRYSFGSLKVDLYFSYAAVCAAATLFCFSIFYHVRVTDDGIYHKKFFAFKTEKYEWQDVRRIDFRLRQTNYKGKSIQPAFVVCCTGGTVDLWGGFGMGSPSAQQLMRFTDILLSKNKDVSISTVGELSEAVLQVLGQYKDGTAQVKKLDAYLNDKIAVRHVRNFYAAVRQLQDEYYADMFDFVMSEELQALFDDIFAEKECCKMLIDNLHSKLSQQPDRFLLTVGDAVVRDISEIGGSDDCLILNARVTASHRFYYHRDFAAMKSVYFRYYNDMCISEDEVRLLQKKAEDEYEKIGRGKFGGIHIDTEENHVFRLVKVNGTYKIAGFEFNITAYTVP